MEINNYTFQAGNPIQRRAHVGVVSSGNLEITVEPTNNSFSTVEVITKFEGHEAIWRAILNRFFTETSCLADLEIHDFGATPGIVFFRLQQAVEIACQKI